MRFLALFAVVAALASCKINEGHVNCRTDADCKVSSPGGICVNVSPGQNVCANPDGTCPSGYRYDPTATLDQACVPPLDGAVMTAGDMAVADMSAADDMKPSSIDMAMLPPDMTNPPDLAKYVPPGWTPGTSPPQSNDGSTGNLFNSLWGVSGNLYASTDKGIARSSNAGAQWSFVANEGFGSGIWADSNSDLWVVGDDGVSHSTDGSTWAKPSTSAPSYLNGVWGTTASNVYVILNGKVLASRDGAGATWNLLASDGKAYNNAISGSASDVYVVGLEGEIQHTGDGQSFGVQQAASSSNQSLYGVWAMGTEAYVVGAGGTIEHTTNSGSTWSTVTVTVTNNGTTVSPQLRSVWGSSSTDVWAVGTEGAVLHYDGTAWTPAGPIVIPAPDFISIWGSDASHVYILGADGEFYVLN